MKNLGQYLEVTLANEILFSGSTFQPDGQKETVDPRKPRRLIVKLVEDFISTNLNPKGPIASQVAQRAERLADLVSATGGLVQPFVATDRSVSGIGNPTPLENGIHLDWATGWPIFPGSGLKGAALAWAGMGGHSLDELGVTSWEDFVDLYIAVFGCGPDEDADGAVGGVVWHDAWVLPGGGLPVVFDVMTPHYGDFQQGRGRDPVLPPADWSDPNPISFLCLPEGTLLQVCLAPRKPLDAGLEWVALHWLTRALADIGLGAKTASGFGRFHPVSESAAQGRG